MSVHHNLEAGLGAGPLLERNQIAECIGLEVIYFVPQCAGEEAADLVLTA
jgi:hypothetical protein